MKNKDGKTVVMYVDNKKLNEEMTKYIEAYRIDPKTRVPEYVGEAILKISTRLATKGNFNRYYFKDEMISDGILDAVKACKNYKPEKFSNPFAYFTKIIYYAFIRRITIEKTKYKTMKDYVKQMDPEDDEMKEIVNALKADIETYEREHK